MRCQKENKNKKHKTPLPANTPTIHSSDSSPDAPPTLVTVTKSHIMAMPGTSANVATDSLKSIPDDFCVKYLPNSSTLSEKVLQKGF